MNPIVDEIITLIVNRVTEATVAKLNETLPTLIAEEVRKHVTTSDGVFSQTQEDVIKDIAKQVALDAAENGDLDDALEIDSKVKSAVDDELGSIEDTVKDIIRDMSFEVSVR